MNQTTRRVKCSSYLFIRRQDAAQTLRPWLALLLRPLAWHQTRCCSLRFEMNCTLKDTPNFVFSLCKDNCNCFTLLQLVRGDSSWQAFGVQVHHKSCLSGVEVGTSTLKWGQTQTIDTKLEELLTSLYSTALRFWLCWNYRPNCETQPRTRSTQNCLDRGVHMLLAMCLALCGGWSWCDFQPHRPTYREMLSKHPLGFHQTQICVVIWIIYSVVGWQRDYWLLWRYFSKVILHWSEKLFSISDTS